MVLLIPRWFLRLVVVIGIGFVVIGIGGGFSAPSNVILVVTDWP